MTASVSVEKPASVEELFFGWDVEVTVDSQHYSEYVRDAIKTHYEKNKGRNKLRFSCIIAEAVNEAFAAITVGENSFTLNPHSKAQFGKDYRLNPYITVGVIDDKTGIRYRFRWVGEDIPHRLMELAVAHDNGENICGAKVLMPLEDGRPYVLGEKNGKKPKDRRKNHDTDKNGQRYKRPERRHHGRVCKEDL